MGELQLPNASESAAAETSAADARGPDDTERMLGRVIAVGLPLATITGALVAGFVASLGSAVLVLASGALLGTIALLWTSVRTLSGDAPLPSDLETLAARRPGTSELGERKGRVLRALKDLESEHAIGKIDDADYHAFVARYREDAKTVMREMDQEIEPARAEAERMALEYLGRRGLAAKGGVSGAGDATSAQPGLRRACPACGTSNEPDASFCKKCGAGISRAKGTKSGHAGA